MERFCKDLKQHAMKIICHEKKEMMPLTDKENKSYEQEKVCYICKKEFVDANDNDNDDDDDDDNKMYQKVRDQCPYTKNTEKLLIMFVI